MTKHKTDTREEWIEARMELLKAAMKALTRLIMPLLCTLTLCAAAADIEGSNTNDQKDYTTTFTVDQTPQEVFNAINNVRGWWSEEIEGSTDKQDAVFKYHFKDLHRCTMKITELVPGKKVVWHVSDGSLNFVKNKNEWTGTDIIFEIAKKGDETEVRFTHVGLVPEYECYHACSDGWRTYINGSLKDLITTGKGRPNVGHAITDSEQKLAH